MLLILSFGLAACGRKETPVPVVPENAKPQIQNLESEIAGNILKLSFTLTGNPAGMGYQIDRTQIDPYCKCPGFWRRYYDQQPLSHLANDNTAKNLNLKTDKIEYLFRIRAVDQNGSFGPWSRAIHARGVDLMHK